MIDLEGHQLHIITVGDALGDFETPDNGAQDDKLEKGE